MGERVTNEALDRALKHIKDSSELNRATRARPPNEAPTVEETVTRMNFIAETNPFDATRQWCADAASLLTTLQATVAKWQKAPDEDWATAFERMRAQGLAAEAERDELKFLLDEGGQAYRAISDLEADRDRLARELERTKTNGLVLLGAAGEAREAAEDERNRLARELEEAREALKPFARVAEHDIGEDEADADFFRPMTDHNRAPRLTVGDLRRAALASGEAP